MSDARCDASIRSAASGRFVRTSSLRPQTRDQCRCSGETLYAAPEGTNLDILPIAPSADSTRVLCFHRSLVQCFMGASLNVRPAQTDDLSLIVKARKGVRKTRRYAPKRAAFTDKHLPECGSCTCSPPRGGNTPVRDAALNSG